MLTRAKRILRGKILRRLSSINIYNMPRIGSEVKIDINPKSKILVLTGYNGSGKSRIISALLESLAMVRNYDYSSVAVDWLMSVEFEKGVELRALKMSRENIPHGTISKEVGKLLRERAPISTVYKKVNKFIKSEKNSALYSSSKSEGEEKSRSFCGATLFDLGDEDEDEFTSSIDVVAYINDRIHFNYERKLEDTVLQKGATIDDTLLVLITEFISSSAVAEVVTERVEYSVKELLAEYISFSKKNKRKIDEKNALDFVTQRVDADKILHEGEDLFSRNELFAALNEFFVTTKRKLVWRNNMICLQLSSGVITEWFYFSKGEKALLALFLMVYLYRDSSLFLLDEPEVSLHVEWQKMIFPALQALAPNSQFIVATHSPFLVMNTGHEQIVNMAKYSADIS
ncbi:AAA family ATPase [Pseudomonas moraviensis]